MAQLETMSDNDVLASLEEQVQSYRVLSKLAQMQHEHVQQSHTEALMDVLLQRQKVLDRIGALETVIGPAKRQWTAFLSGASADVRPRLESLMKESRKLLEEITSADRDDVLVLQHRKLNLGKAIGAAGAARRINRNVAMAAYGKRTPAIDVGG